MKGRSAEKVGMKDRPLVRGGGALDFLAGGACFREGGVLVFSFGTAAAGGALVLEGGAAAGSGRLFSLLGPLVMGAFVLPAGAAED